MRETALAIRRLVRSPGFTAIAVATIAVSAVPALLFRLVDRAVLPPMPFPRASELVLVRQGIDTAGGRRPLAYPWIDRLRSEGQALDVAAETLGPLSLQAAGEDVAVMTGAVTPNFFDVLEVRPLLGRVFREDENRTPLGHPVVVIGERLWRQQFGGDAQILSSGIRLGGRNFTVIGVMPESFHEAWFDWTGMARREAWIPAMMAPLVMRVPEWRTERPLVDPTAAIWLGLARLRPGQTLATARADISLLEPRLRTRWPETRVFEGRLLDVEPLAEVAIDPRIANGIAMLRVAGFLVLGVGILNLAQLFGARAVERSRSLGLHAVLGASTLVLAWGMLSEAGMIAVAGAGLTWLLARGVLMALAFVEPSTLATPMGMTFDPSALAVDARLVPWTVLLCVLAGFAAAVVPAWRARRADVSLMLRGGSVAAAGGLRQLRLSRPPGLLVVGEATLALALTLPALLVARSVGRLVNADLGFEGRGVTVATLRLPSPEYSAEKSAALISGALEEIRATPGVAAASWVNGAPLSDTFMAASLGSPGNVSEGVMATIHVVSPDAFRTLRIPLLQGRDFGLEDAAPAPPVAVLSRLGERQLGGAVLGTKVEVPALGRTVEIVGIVGEVPYRDLAREPMAAIYLPLTQVPSAEGRLLVKSLGGTGATGRRLQEVVASLDARLRLSSIEAMSDQTERALSRFRGAAWLLGGASVLVLFLTGVGIYGLLSTLVARSSREIGVRMALGAAPVQVRWSLARSTALLVGIGLVLGSIAGAAAAVHLRSFLYGVGGRDARALLGLSAIAALLATAAALRPAWRASRVDPAVVLRGD